MKTKKKKNYRERGGALVVWNIPETIKRKFHAACTMKGVTMREVIRDFMVVYSQPLSKKT